LLTLHIRELGKIVSGHDTSIGGAPTVDVHPGDGGGIGWGSLTDKHGGTKPRTLTLSQRERGYEEQYCSSPARREEMER